MDGRSNHRNKAEFLNLSGIVFNTGPGRTNVINFEVWGIKKLPCFCCIT